MILYKNERVHEYKLAKDDTNEIGIPGLQSEECVCVQLDSCNLDRRTPFTCYDLPRLAYAVPRRIMSHHSTCSRILANMHKFSCCQCEFRSTSHQSVLNPGNMLPSTKSRVAGAMSRAPTRCLDLLPGPNLMCLQVMGLAHYPNNIIVLCIDRWQFIIL